MFCYTTGTVFVCIKLFIFFFIFYKNFFFYNMLALNSSSFRYSIFFICYRYFYFRQLVFFFKKLNLTLVGFYMNNITKSVIFKIFYFFNLFFTSNRFPSENFFFSWRQQIIHEQLFKNLFLLSFKTSNFRIYDTFYKNFFFYLLSFTTLNWFQQINNFKYYLNFLLLNPNLFVSTVCPGFFFSIYNF